MSGVSPANAKVKVRVKVCGFTRAADVDCAVDLGADFVGLNFSPTSSRCVTPDQARDLVAAVRGRTQVVGIFVGTTHAEVAAVVERVPLDFVQLHGDEPPELLETLALAGLPPVIRAFRVAGSPQPAELEPWRGAEWWLFDKYHPAHFGGVGEPWDWAALAALPRSCPVLVAGGVRPGRARAALEASGADGIDVCSGVESSPGIKDHDALARLFAEVADVRIAAPA